jgi:hypothetical protein
MGATTLVERGAYQILDPDRDKSRLAMAISQKIRLGALDGLHVEVMNAFFLSGEAFQYGGTTARVQIPMAVVFTVNDVGAASWLVLRGGGSYAGHAFGEAGLRVLVRGDGDRGSLFFTPTVGGGYLRGLQEAPCPDYTRESFGADPDAVCGEPVGYGGPMIGFQIEWRP